MEKLLPVYPKGGKTTDSPPRNTRRTRFSWNTSCSEKGARSEPELTWGRYEQHMQPELASGRINN
jgi:hypothetical protein